MQQFEVVKMFVTRIKGKRIILKQLFNRHFCDVVYWVKLSELSCGRTVLYIVKSLYLLDGRIEVDENQSSEE